MSVKAGGWSIIGSLVDKALMLSTYVLVSRSVDQEQFGYLIAVLLFIELLTYIGGFGVADNILRKDTISHEFLSNSFYFLKRVSLICIAFMVFAVTPLAYFWAGSDLAELVLMVSIYPVLTIFSGFYVSILQRDMHFKKIAIRTIIISFFAGASGVVLALSGWGVLSLLIAKYIYSILDVIILRYLTGFSPVESARGGRFSEFISYGWKLSSAQVFNFLNSRMYEVFITLIFGPAMLAIFDVGRKFLMTLYRVVLTPLNRVILSAVSRSEDKMKVYSLLVNVVGAIVIPLAAILGAMSEELVPLFFGDAWSISAQFMVLLSIASIAQVSGWFLPNLLISYGHSNSILILQVIGFVIQFLFCVFGYLSGADVLDYVLLIVISVFVSVVVRVVCVWFYLGINITDLWVSMMRNAAVFVFVFFMTEYVYNKISTFWFVFEFQIPNLNVILDIILSTFLVFCMLLPYGYYVYREYIEARNDLY
jgi:O-antigen/teichoic acid export membrane protein